MRTSRNPEIRQLQAQVDNLVARRAERAASAHEAFALRPARVEVLKAQPWWRDHHEAFAASIDLLWRLVIDNDGRRWGDVAHPQQWDDALAVLDPKSTCRYHFLTRARWLVQDH